MRSRKALMNTMAAILYEMTAIICGFIVPKLILDTLGSQYNGLTSSITQFLGYVSLMRAGIGGVTRAALYKPLAHNDMEGVSAIVNATEKFLKRVSVIFAISLVGFACVYPFFVRQSGENGETFSWFFTFSLVLIIGISTFVQYFFGLTYQMLLNSDQRQCVISFVQIGTIILNTVIAAVLLKLGASIHIVKLGSAVAFSLNPIVINLYARKKYKINKKIPPNNDAIKDRWDCFGLQVANFVNANTDMFILTLFCRIEIVSVYTVYYMVTSGIRKFIMTFVNGIGAAFGNMFAKKEMDAVHENLRLFELITFSMTNFLFSVTGSMILSFVGIYSTGIKDAGAVDYIQPAFAFVLVIGTMFMAYRIPYQTVVEAVGHFRQTRNGAFFEAIMNITVSVVLVIFFGLIGVAVGTLCATVFRTFQYATYMSKNLVKRSLWFLIKRLILSAADFLIVIAFSFAMHFDSPSGYMQWIVQSLIMSFAAGIVVFGTEIIFYNKDLKLTIKKIKGAVFKKFKKKKKTADTAS